MNKLFKKLFAPIAILSMALGVTLSANNQADSVVAKAAPTTVTVTRADFTGTAGYSKGTWSKGSISGEGVIFFDTTSNIQVSTNAGRQPYPHNLVATPGPITSISVTMPGTGTLRSLTPRMSSSSAVTTATAGTALTAQTFTSNTQTLTWNISVELNYKYFHLVPGGNTNWANFTITYEEVSQEFGILDHITVDTTNTRLTYYVGDTFSLTGLSVTAYDTVNFSKLLSSGYTSDYDNYTFIQDDIGSKIITISYTEGGITKTSSFTIGIEAAPVLQKFTKVTSLSQLHLGAQYVIAGTKSDVVWAMSTIQGTNNRTAITATMSGSDISESSQTQMFLLEEGSEDNTFAFKSINGDVAGQYIYSASSTANNLKSQASVDGNASWRITLNSGITSMVSQGTYTHNVLMLNSSSALFASYTGGQTNIDLYVDLTTIVSNDYSEAFNLAYDINVGMGSNASGTCVSTLTAISGRYNLLSSTAKMVFDSNSGAEFAQARERVSYLTSWVAANPSARPLVAYKGDNNLFAVITIGAIGLTTILSYYFVNRKKVQ